MSANVSSSTLTKRVFIPRDKQDRPDYRLRCFHQGDLPTGLRLEIADCKSILAQMRSVFSDGYAIPQYFDVNDEQMGPIPDIGGMQPPFIFTREGRNCKIQVRPFERKERKIWHHQEQVEASTKLISSGNKKIEQGQQQISGQMLKKGRTRSSLNTRSGKGQTSQLASDPTKEIRPVSQQCVDQTEGQEAMQQCIDQKAEAVESQRQFFSWENVDRAAESILSNCKSFGGVHQLGIVGGSKKGKTAKLNGFWVVEVLNRILDATEKPVISDRKTCHPDCGSYPSEYDKPISYPH